jgi:hypothetical protein
MSASYWYRTGPLQPSGPHSYAELLALRDNGLLTPDSLISNDGRQFQSVDVALGSDFFRRETPVDTPSNAECDDIEEPENPPEKRSFLTAADSIVTLLARGVAHAGMLLTLWLAKFEWDIPNMQRTVTRQVSNDCQLYMLKNWYLLAMVAALLTVLAWILLIWMKRNKKLSGNRLEWAYSTMALIAFLFPVTLTIAFILGVLGDICWGLAGIR